jgi:hypothetical protein
LKWNLKNLVSKIKIDLKIKDKIQGDWVDGKLNVKVASCVIYAQCYVILLFDSLILRHKT